MMGLLCGIIVYYLRKERLELKYTLLWLLALLIVLIVVIFPQLINTVAALVGVYNPVNLVFYVQGVFVVIILLSMTAIVSGLNRRIRRLAQEVAILEERLRQAEGLGLKASASRGVQEQTVPLNSAAGKAAQ